MNQTLELLISIVGEDEAGRLLASYIKKNYNPAEGDDETTYKSSYRKKTKNKKMAWTDEDKQLIEAKARELYPQIKNWAAVSSQISSELGKGHKTSSIYNFIYRMGIVKEFQDVSS